MKKVEFGFSTSENPTGSWEGIGINSMPEGAVSGDFLGIVDINGEDYLVSRTTLAFGNDPKYMGKLTVRRVTKEKYFDASGVLFLDMEENETTRATAEVLEEEKITEESIKPLINKEYDSLINRSDEIIATSINHEAFERKRMFNEEDKKEIITKNETVYF